MYLYWYDHKSTKQVTRTCTTRTPVHLYMNVHRYMYTGYIEVELNYTLHHYIHVYMYTHYRL